LRVCSIEDLETGSILDQPLYTYIGGKRTLLLGRGAKFTSQMIERIKSLGYVSVYINEPGTEHIIPSENLAEATRDSALLHISHYYEEMKERAVELLKSAKKEPLDYLNNEAIHVIYPNSTILRESVQEIFQDLFLIGKVQKYSVIAGVSRTNALHNHVLNVAILSLLIGNSYDFNDDEQRMLCMGALLHDIGKTIFNKFSAKTYRELNAEERADIRHHPELGEKLLNRARTITEVERQIILQHHERQDGSGYPMGLIGDNSIPCRSQFTKPKRIFRLAEIVAVADMFDNLVSGNLVNKRYSPKEALMELLTASGEQLNSSIVETLSSLVTLYTLGENVEIVTHSQKEYIGFKGVVGKTESEDFESVAVVLLFNAKGKRIEPVNLDINIGGEDRIKVLVSR